MCGIAGIIANHSLTDDDFSRSKKASNQLARRGPYAEDIKNYDTAILVHRRLSIIDTNASSNQPMEDFSARYSIVFNGEIYNYKELKKDLLEKRSSFRAFYNLDEDEVAVGIIGRLAPLRIINCF